MPENSWGGGSFTIGDGPPTTPTDTTAAGADTTLVVAVLKQALGVDTMVEVAEEMVGGDDLQLGYNNWVTDFDFGSYFVYAPKNPLVDNVNGVVGFSRDALITETANTAIASSMMTGEFQNTVRDPIRKVTRNIWTSTSDFKSVQLYESDVADYDTDLTFAENIQNINFNTEKASFLKVIYPENDEDQDELFELQVADNDGRPIRRNKFILNFPPNIEDPIEKQEAQIKAFFDSMYRPSTRDETLQAYVYPYTAQMTSYHYEPEEKAWAENYFGANGWSPGGWACSAESIGEGIPDPDMSPPHVVIDAADIIYTQHSSAQVDYVFDPDAPLIEEEWQNMDGEVYTKMVPDPNATKAVTWWNYPSEEKVNETLRFLNEDWAKGGGWHCWRVDDPSDPRGFRHMCAPIADQLGTVECIKLGEVQDIQLAYVFELPKIGLFDVKSPFVVNPAFAPTPLPNYQFTDHTFEMPLPFPILNSDLSNLSVNTLLGDYDIIFNDTDKDRNYENFVSTHYLYEGVCAYTLASAQLNKLKSSEKLKVKNLTYQELIGGGDINDVSDLFVNQKSLKKYLDAYANNFVKGQIHQKNKNILIRGGEVSKEVKKITPIVPAAINISFANRQKPDFAKTLSATGLDVVLMSKIAEQYTSKEAVQNTEYNNDPAAMFLTSMITDVVISDQPAVIENAGALPTSDSPPTPQNFLDVETNEVSSYDLIKFFDDMWKDSNHNLKNILNDSVDTQVLVENEEKDFLIGDTFCLKNYSAQICKTELMQRASENTRNIIEIYEGKKCAHETLFFRIEKRKVGSPAAEPLQNFYVFNDGQPIIEYLDTQVEYGVKYRYRVFAYVVVFGTQYQPYLDDPKYNVNDTKFVTNALPLSMLYKPSVRLIQVPYHTYDSLTVLDSPPLAPQVEFYPFKYEDDKVFISFTNTNGFVRENPVPIRPGDNEKIINLLKAQKSRIELTFESDDEPASYEVYRTATKPDSYNQIPLHNVVHVKADGKNLMDAVEPNKDYWYFFRAIDDHGNFSNPSIIYKLRLISDDVSYLNVSHMVEDNEVAPNAKGFSKFINIEHAGGGIHGEPETNLLGKTLKVRVRSLETDKKIDLNIAFSRTHLTNTGTETN